MRDLLAEIKEEPITQLGDRDLLSEIGTGYISPPIEPEQEPEKGTIKSTAKATARVTGVLAGGLLAFPISGLVGGLITPFVGLKKGTEIIESIASQPSRLLETPEEQKSMGYIMKPIEVIQESATWWGDYTLKKTDSPNLAASVASAVEAATLIGLPGLKAKLKASVKAGNIKQARIHIEEIRQARLAKWKEKGRSGGELIEDIKAVRKQAEVRPSRIIEPPPSKIGMPLLKPRRDLVREIAETRKSVSVPAPLFKKPMPEVTRKIQEAKILGKIKKTDIKGIIGQNKYKAYLKEKGLTAKEGMSRSVIDTYKRKQATEAINKFRKEKDLPEFYTADFMGFQNMYESFVNWIRVDAFKKGRSHGIEDIAFFTRGEIVKQRHWNRRSSSGEMVQMKAPPIYAPELEIVKGLPELPPRILEKAGTSWLENPIRTFETLGDSAKELWYRPMKEGEHAVALERKAVRKRTRQYKKDSTWRSRKRIGAYAIGQQKRGVGILKSMGVKEVPKLTPKEMKLYNVLRGEFETFYHRLQKARRLAGKEPFPKVDNYFTFIRDLSLLERLGINPVFTNMDTLLSQFVHLKTTPFRFAKARAKAGIMPVELDALGLFEKYSEPAIKHIHLSPIISKGRELLLTFGSKKGGDRWKLSEEAPRTSRFITEWLDFQAGQKPPTSFPPIIERGLLKLNQNLTFSVLSANIRSALIQASAIRGAFVEAGPKYTWLGIQSLLDPKMRNLALTKSKHLLSRDYDVAVRDAMDALRLGRIGEIKKKVGGGFLKPLQLLDMETAKATWVASYLKAKREMKYSEAKAVNYADDITIKTQASAMPSDLAPIQRTALGKTLSLFQTFVINEWGWLTRDVVGIKNPRMNRVDAFKKGVSFMVATTLINMFYEDVIGINSPFPTPIRAFQDALEEGASIPSASVNVAKELMEQVPIIGGGLRYRKGILGAGVETLQEGVKKPTIATVGKLLGVPGTAQIQKTIKARKRGETPYGQAVGTYTKKKEKGKRPFMWGPKTSKHITIDGKKYGYLGKLPGGGIRIKDLTTGELGTYIG